MSYVIDMTNEAQRETYRMIVLKSALGLYAKTKMVPNRNFTITKMLAMASDITGNSYPRGQKGAIVAHAELQALLNPPC